MPEFSGTEWQFRAATREKARSQEGYAERGSNITKYWVALEPRFQGNPWCGAFTTWVFKELTGVNPRGSFNSFFTPSIVAYAKKVGAWKKSKPEPGDWVLYNFPGGNFVDHVGIVESGRTAIEGNTSPSDRGSQSNGGGVYRRKRSSRQIAGWVDLIGLAKSLGVTFGGAPASTPAVPAYTGKRGTMGVFPLEGGSMSRHWFGLESNNPLNHSGAWESDRPRIKFLQKRLGVPETGRYDARTFGAVQYWQARLGLVRDGQVGPITWANL